MKMSFCEHSFLKNKGLHDETEYLQMFIYIVFLET